MNTSRFAWKRIARTIIPLLLSTMVLVSLSVPASACPPFQLTLHDDQLRGDSYYTLTYKDSSGRRQHVVCQRITSLNWADVPVQLPPNQTVLVQYFRDQSCTHRYRYANLPIPGTLANGTAAHCWLNPVNVDTANFSGCVNPSQTLPFNQ